MIETAGPLWEEMIRWSGQSPGLLLPVLRRVKDSESLDELLRWLEDHSRCTFPKPGELPATLVDDVVETAIGVKSGWTGPNWELIRFACVLDMLEDWGRESRSPGS